MPPPVRVIADPVTGVTSWVRPLTNIWVSTLTDTLPSLAKGGTPTSSAPVLSTVFIGPAAAGWDSSMAAVEDVARTTPTLRSNSLTEAPTRSERARARLAAGLDNPMSRSGSRTATGR